MTARIADTGRRLHVMSGDRRALCGIHIDPRDVYLRDGRPWWDAQPDRRCPHCERAEARS